MGQAFLVKLGTASFWGILGTASFWGILGTASFTRVFYGTGIFGETWDS